MIKLALILAVVSSCLPQAPGIPVAETEYADTFEEVILAWEADPTLPTVGERCDAFKVAIVEREDLPMYEGPDDPSGLHGFLSGETAVVIHDGRSVESLSGTVIHEAIHWLTQCTGLAREIGYDTDLDHADPRLWEGPQSVRTRATDGTPYDPEATP